MRTLAVSAERSERRIPVAQGRVACPRIGLVDIDRCRECPYLSRLEEADAEGQCASTVVCSLTAVEGPDMNW